VPAWRANPEFRAERGVEVALHGNWVAIDAHERAMLAQALFTSLGGGAVAPDPLGRLASATDLATARIWGLAIRLGQRLSGGLAGPLQRSKIDLGTSTVRLMLESEDRALYGEAVEKRHAALASAMARKATLG
jgi:exopolyphosphatase/guanosine-5'-triphosphate,3'-diphosphate pyrophosphatase